VTDVIELWPAGAPGSELWTQHESAYRFSDPFPHRVVRNVTRPTLTAHLPEPDVATGAGVVVCPGGAYHFLAVDHEGAEVASALTARGIAAFVLKYRVIETPAADKDFLDYRDRLEHRARSGDRDWFHTLVEALRPLATADATRALQVVAERAQEWHLTPRHIGLLGFSAGGSVALDAALAAPDGTAATGFVAVIYGGLARAVVVPPDAPPLFQVIAGDDRTVSVDLAMQLASAWQQAGRSCELHVYARGGHGFGMHRQGLPADGWLDRFIDWLPSQLGYRGQLG